MISQFKVEKNMTDNNDSKGLLEFLKMTKKGQYSLIKESHLKYIRMHETTQINMISDDEFYYGIK
jgi:hypothetical protein